MTQSQYPAQAPVSLYPTASQLPLGASANVTIGGVQTRVAPDGSQIIRIMPEGDVTQNVNPVIDLKPFASSQVTATGSGSTVGITLATGQVVVVPTGTTVQTLFDGTQLLTYPSGTTITTTAANPANDPQIDIVMPFNPVAGLVTPLGTELAKSALTKLVTVTASDATPLVGDAITTPIGTVITKVTSYLPSLTPAEATVTGNTGLTTAQLIARTVARQGEAIARASEQTAKQLVKITLYAGQAVAVGTMVRTETDEDNVKQPLCIQDKVMKICTKPPVTIQSGWGDIAPSGATSTGAWAGTPIGDGFHYALQVINPPTGKYLPSFVDGLVALRIRTYDAWCLGERQYTMRQRVPLYSGGPWTQPPEFINAWPARDQTLWPRYLTAARGNKFPEGIIINGPLALSGLYQPLSGASSVGIRAGFQSLFVASSGAFGIPSASQLHYMQAVVTDDRERTQSYVLINGLDWITGTGPAEILASARTFIYQQLSTGYNWIIDNTVSITNGTYDEPKYAADGGQLNAGGLALGQNFIDQPSIGSTSIGGLNARNGFALFPMWYLQADRRTPSLVPVTYQYTPAGSTNYVFIMSWNGADWFAAPGDPSNMAQAWKNAVTSDAGYNPPPPKTCGIYHFRNDFLVSSTGSTPTLFVPTDQVASGNAAIVTAINCLGGTLHTAPTFDGPYPKNYTPIAIGSLGWFYEYKTSPANAEPRDYLGLV